MSDIPVDTDYSTPDSSSRQAIDLGLQATSSMAGSAALAEAQSKMADAASRAGLDKLTSHVAPAPAPAPAEPSLRDELAVPTVAPTTVSAPQLAPTFDTDSAPVAPPPTNLLGDNEKLVVPNPYQMLHGYSDARPADGFTPPTIEPRPDNQPVRTEVGPNYEQDSRDLAEISQIRTDADARTSAILNRMMTRRNPQ